MLKHKKLFRDLASKYGLTYWQGEGGLYPTNYHNFKDKTGEQYLSVEIIPKGRYLKTAYVMFTGSEIEGVDKEDVYRFIVEDYQKQKEGVGVDFCVDNNIGFENFII